MMWESFLSIVGDQDLVDILDDEGSLTELFETGSATIRVDGRDFVLTVKAQEIEQ